MRIILFDLVCVLLCDKIFALRGWAKSTGALAEVAVGNWAGKQIVEQENMWEEI